MFGEGSFHCEESLALLSEQSDLQRQPEEELTARHKALKASWHESRWQDSDPYPSVQFMRYEKGVDSGRKAEGTVAGNSGQRLWNAQHA
jgi:hypothetical protein